ncbi:MAG: hypothetical protein NWE86_06370, partial [Candidatus Bathyarchaeota archaeon]|nr:hypothetical protein [Candidatus Bathyarchaeota archaeon]
MKRICKKRKNSVVENGILAIKRNRRIFGVTTVKKIKMNLLTLIFTFLLTSSMFGLMDQSLFTYAQSSRIDFESSTDFEVGIGSPIWNNSAGPWMLYYEYPQPENPIYPNIPNFFEQST